MYKYEMDPTKTVGATEQTRDAGQTDGRTDRRTDGWTEWNPPTTSLCSGYENVTFAICGKHESKDLLSVNLIQIQDPNVVI